MYARGLERKPQFLFYNMLHQLLPGSCLQSKFPNITPIVHITSTRSYWQCSVYNKGSFIYINVKVTVRPTVGQSVLVSGSHLGPATNFSHYLFDYFFRQLRGCYFVAPSLRRRRVCNLLLLLVSPAQSRSVYPH
jgi:hypothetical protein